jgi:proteasome activator subunit 4
MANLAEKHVDPGVSDPKLVEKYRRTAPKRRETLSSAVPPPQQQEEPSREATPAPPASANANADADGDSKMADASSTAPSAGSKPSTMNGSAPSAPKWKGIRRDVGIFTYEQWDFMMLRMLRAMAIPVGNVRKSGNHFISQHGGEMASANADAAANATTMKMTKPTEKLHSLAVLLVYSMAEDSPILDRTPAGSKQPSRRPSVHEGLSTLSAAATTNGAASPSSTAPARKAYVGGSRALDSLSKFINATETFFHPSNYGHWSPMLSRFLQNILWEFTKRWTEEEKGDCKTPKEWRLTKKIRREFVAMTRQVALLAMFSKDPMSMGSAQSALKSMAFLEPRWVIFCFYE